MTSTSERVAEAVVRRLEARNLRAWVRPLAAWPSATSEIGAVIMLDVGASSRPVAFADIWHVDAHGPPSLGPRPRWSWGTEAFPLDGPLRIPDETVANGLARLVASWAPRQGEVGMLDVVIAILEMLPECRAHVLDREAWIGLDKGARRWPAFARVDVRADCIEVTHFTPPPDTDRHWKLRTRVDVAGAHADIVASFTKVVGWCERFVEQRRAMDRFADVLAVELGKVHLPRWGEHWHVSQPSVDQFSVRDRPMAWIAGVSIYEEGERVVVGGVAYNADTPMATLVEAVWDKVQTTFPLREGARYRLKRPLKGCMTGTIATFVGAQDIRPNDTLYYTFDTTTEFHQGRQDFSGFGLSEVVPEDAAVMHAMHDWFECVEDEIDPQGALTRRVRSLALVGRHLREHGDLDAAEGRLREALSLDPDHAMAIFQLGWIAAQRERWADALDYFRRAREINPNHFDARSNEAWALGHLGQWEEALGVLDDLATVKPDWALVHRNRAWVLRSLSRLDEAKAACDRALELAPRDAGALEEARLIAAAHGR